MDLMCKVVASTSSGDGATVPIGSYRNLDSNIIKRSFREFSIESSPPEDSNRNKLQFHRGRYGWYDNQFNSQIFPRFSTNFLILQYLLFYSFSRISSCSYAIFDYFNSIFNYCNFLSISSSNCSILSSLSKNILKRSFRLFSSVLPYSYSKLLYLLFFLLFLQFSIFTIQAMDYDSQNFWSQKSDQRQLPYHTRRFAAKHAYRNANGNGFNLQRQQELFLQRKQQSHLDMVAAQSFFGHSVKCFSCMSKLYEAVWPALTTVYKRPLNFSDACDTVSGAQASARAEAGDTAAIRDFDADTSLVTLADGTTVPLYRCSTICVGMWEETTVAGVKIRAHIRGCMDALLHAGFNETIVSSYRWMQRDSCRDYRKRDLFKLAAHRSDDSTVHVCTCYADYCNGADAESSGSAARRIIIIALAAIVALFTLAIRYFFANKILL